MVYNTQCSTNFNHVSRKLAKENENACLNACFHQLLLTSNVRNRAHQDTKLLVLILQFGAMTPLQKMRVQQADVTERTLVKPQTMENHVEM